MTTFYICSKFTYIRVIEEERDKRLHVEIKPLSNGSGPISASVDELRATVENISLLPAGTQTLKVMCKINTIKLKFVFNLYLYAFMLFIESTKVIER